MFSGRIFCHAWIEQNTPLLTRLIWEVNLKDREHAGFAHVMKKSALLLELLINCRYGSGEASDVSYSSSLMFTERRRLANAGPANVCIRNPWKKNTWIKKHNKLLRKTCGLRACDWGILLTLLIKDVCCIFLKVSVKNKHFHKGILFFKLWSYICFNIHRIVSIDVKD